MNDEIRIIPITTKKGLKTFIQFHYDLYRDHKFAIPFLRFDEMNTLDPKKNPAFEFCEAQYFLAFSGRGSPDQSGALLLHFQLGPADPYAAAGGVRDSARQKSE